MMASLLSFPYRLVVAAIFFASIFHLTSALNVEYCSNLNTAQTGANSSIYQSNGLCHNFCLDDFAFAILQNETCWCSNDAPGSTTSTSDCSFQCPGYPNDLCGDPTEDLFGYLALSKSPTATVDGSSIVAASTSSEQVTVTANPSATAILDTTEDTPSPSSMSATYFSSTSATTSNTPTVATTSSTTTTHSSSETSEASETWTPTPVTSLETVTGQVRTVTVTPTVPPNSETLTGVQKKSKGSGLSTGAAVGLTVGLVALVALVCSIIYFCIRRRQKERAAQEFDQNASQRGSSAGLGGAPPSRTMSEHSRYVLGTDGRQVVETWEPETQDGPGSRKSRLMPVDPRLDPFAAVYQRGENKSRESVNTIRDDHDYSRRVHQQAPILRATNPDK